MVYDNFKKKIIFFLKNRKKGSSFLVYNVLGNLFTFLLNFILPFLMLSSQYGVFALCFALHNVVIAFFTFGLDTSTLKFAIEEKLDKESKILSKSFLVWLVFSLIFLPAIMLLVKYLTSINIFDVEFKYLVLIVISAVLISYQRILLSYYIANSEIKKYGELFVFNKFFQAVSILFAVMIFSNEIENISYAFFVQGIITTIYLLFIQKKYTLLKINKNKFQEMKTGVISLAKFTMPLSLNTLGNIGYNYGFNIFVSPFLSLSQLGVLNIFTQFGTASRMILSALESGYLPKFYLDFKTNFEKSVKSFFNYIFQNSVLIIAFVFCLSILYYYFANHLDEEYNILTLLIFFVGTFLYTFKSIGVNYLILEGKTFTISLITVISSIINLSLGVFFTKEFGFMGCVVSLTIGYIIQVLLFNFDLILKLKLKK